MARRTYTGPYKVVRIFRKSSRRQVLERGLTAAEARRVVDRHPSRTGSMVVFMEQYTADKYFTDAPAIVCHCGDTKCNGRHPDA